MSIETWVDV